MNDNENIIVTVPEYLFELDNLDDTVFQDNSSGDQASEDLIRSGSELRSQEENSQSDIDDVIIILNDLLTNSDSSTSSLESLTVQIDNLNENINTLNENVKVGVSILFVLLVFTLIKVVSAILNKILGLGTC